MPHSPVRQKKQAPADSAGSSKAPAQDLNIRLIKTTHMKKILLALLLAAGFIVPSAKAQVKVKLSINIGNQPAWGPTGYDHADYYYLPDADCYYDVNAQLFYYSDNGRWVSGSSLPPRYGKVDLYNTYKVVVNQPKPYLHADVYRKKYARYKNSHTRQPAIRDSKDEKYFASKGHPQHADWEKKHGHR
jgi:hypothetical protein